MDGRILFQNGRSVDYMGEPLFPCRAFCACHVLYHAMCARGLLLKAAPCWCIATTLLGVQLLVGCTHGAMITCLQPCAGLVYNRMHQIGRPLAHPQVSLLHHSGWVLGMAGALGAGCVVCGQ